MPPARKRIETFVTFTDCAPGEVLGIMLPENRAATMWMMSQNGFIGYPVARKVQLPPGWREKLAAANA